MKKNLLLTMICAFILCTGSLFAQKQVTIATWDFESFDGTPGTATYTFWGTDEVWATTRPWALNEYENKRDVTFGAVYEGKISGEAIFANTSHTLGTPTTLGGWCMASSGNWNRDDAIGKSDRYFLMDNISTVGVKDIVITLYLAGVGNTTTPPTAIGPTEFKFGYKVGDGNWVDGAFKTVRSDNNTNNKIDERDLWTENVPAACNNQAKVKFRWLVGETDITGAPISSSAIVRIDKIAVVGTSTGVGIVNPKIDRLIYTEGSRLFSGANAKVTVYDTAGVPVYAGAIQKDSSIELSKGVYIVKAVTANNTESSKIIIR